MKVLHVIATPRGQDSNSLKVSRAFLDRVASRRSDVDVDDLDLFATPLPDLSGLGVAVKYQLMAGQDADQGAAEWPGIITLINRFLAADAYVIASPMWNFGIPYRLKHFIDCLVQPGHTFRLDGTGGVVPLVTGKRMVCIMASGSDYSPGGPIEAYDFQAPYLRLVFGFIGITDLRFVTVAPTDVPGQREIAYERAIAEVGRIADEAWSSGVPRKAARKRVPAPGRRTAVPATRTVTT